MMHRYPAPGCVVEFMENNAPQIAMVLEGDESRSRLLLPSRRELKLSTNRILPWYGPSLDINSGRDQIVRTLEECKKTRETLSREIPLLEAWEMAQGEISEAPASWFAELFDSKPDENTIAAFGRALLDLKSHFRFQAPLFQVYDQETVDKRLHEEKLRKEKEALVAGGNNFLRQLWAASLKHADPATISDVPEEEVARRIETILMDRLLDADCQKDEALWQQLARGLPEVPHLPFQLLVAWGKLPPHYNFLLDQAAYERGDEWWKKYEDEVSATLGKLDSLPAEFGQCGLPFISIDGISTRDIDDAFYAEETENGYLVTIALACPALYWKFESGLDSLVIKRGTSIYLPEGDLHMLPQRLGLDAFSLLARRQRPALCIQLNIDKDGNILETKPFLAKIELSANLVYGDVEKFLAGENTEQANQFSTTLRTGWKVAQARKKNRIAAGAIIMDRFEPELIIEGEGRDTRVLIKNEEPVKNAKDLVAELMIAASSGIAKWAALNNIPLLYRTQDVAVPKEFAGEWSRPEDLAKIIKVLAPSLLEVEPKKHAALGAASYAPITSPLRRYSDLVNEYQIMHWLTEGRPHFENNDLEKLLTPLSLALEGAGHVQRYRPRYWKLLHVQQKGPQVWWPGTITEENELFVTVNFPDIGLFVRAKRRLFSDRAAPGAKVSARLGKVNALYNEIQIMEADIVE